MESNYIKSARLKIAKTDNITEIFYIKLNTRIKEMLLRLNLGQDIDDLYDQPIFFEGGQYEK